MKSKIDNQLPWSNKHQNILTIIALGYHSTTHSVSKQTTEQCVKSVQS